LTGRVSDATIVRCRSLLADREESQVGPEVVAALRRAGVAVSQAELDFLANALAGSPAQAELELVEVTDAPDLLRYVFAAKAPNGVSASSQRVDDVAIETAAALDGAGEFGARGAYRPTVTRAVGEADVCG
jgi:hypothetical protein